MGGINCPPPPFTDRPTPEVKAAYVNSLGRYCLSLFNGARSFYAANAEIEQAVLAEGNLDAPIQMLKDSEAQLQDAKSRVGAVASLFEQISASQAVDFGIQLIMLDTAVRQVSAARMELELIDEQGSLQDRLWSQAGLTDNMVGAMEAINASLAWQGSFAKSLTLTVA